MKCIIPYPFYLSVSLGVLVAMALWWSRQGERWPKLRRAIVIAALSTGLVAVVFLPVLDGYPLIRRTAGLDTDQRFSQPISYALFNYVVSQPDWFRTDILGTASGWNWFYIGAPPLLAALVLAPIAFLFARRRRRILVTIAILTLVLLVWHANRFTPFKYVYEWVPLLYNLRFPNRLLILAASPLLVLGGLGVQFVFTASRLWRGSVFTLSRKDGKPLFRGLSVTGIAQGLLLFLMLLSVRDVYRINKDFAFVPGWLNARAFTALSWLKAHDPELYYINIGGGAIYWDWTPAAYQLELPVLNFEYGRHLKSAERQYSPESPFYARPRYLLAQPDQPRPEDAQFLQDFGGVGLWYLPGALPFAFSAPPARLQPFASLAPEDASPLRVSLDGPNRLVVSGEPAQPGDQLVVLVSHYPGWRVWMDGSAAQMSPANGYLGVAMLPGEHIYTFAFTPTKHYVGLGISVLTLVIVLGLLLADVRAWFSRPKAEQHND